MQNLRCGGWEVGGYGFGDKRGDSCIKLTCRGAYEKNFSILKSIIPPTACSLEGWDSVLRGTRMSLCEFESADPNYSNTLKRYQNKAHTTCESFRKHCCKFLPYLYCYRLHDSYTEYSMKPNTQKWYQNYIVTPYKEQHGCGSKIFERGELSVSTGVRSMLHW